MAPLSSPFELLQFPLHLNHNIPSPAEPNLAVGSLQLSIQRSGRISMRLATPPRPRLCKRPHRSSFGNEKIHQGGQYTTSPFPVRRDIFFKWPKLTLPRALACAHGVRYLEENLQYRKSVSGLRKTLTVRVHDLRRKGLVKRILFGCRSGLRKPSQKE